MTGSNPRDSRWSTRLRIWVVLPAPSPPSIAMNSPVEGATGSGTASELASVSLGSSAEVVAPGSTRVSWSSETARACGATLDEVSPGTWNAFMRSTPMPRTPMGENKKIAKIPVAKARRPIALKATPDAERTHVVTGDKLRSNVMLRPHSNVARSMPTASPTRRENSYFCARTPTPTLNAVRAMTTAFPDSSLMRPAKIMNRPAATSAKAVRRGRVIPGAKVGPDSYPAAHPKSTAAIIRPTAPCP